MIAADPARPASGIVTAAALVAVTFALLGPTAAAAPPDIPRRAVEPSTCPIVVAPAIAGRASCGRLTVPEDRRRADGRTVAVEFMMVAAERPDPARLPLLFVMGGNGSGLKMAQRQPRLVASLAKHDTVIFVDHRGSTPWGRPDMSCPEYPEGLDAALPGADPARVEACRKHLAARLDINLYGPYEAAQDLRDLRLALGLPRWNVYGVSYGTTVAQRLLGLDAAAIGGIVLDGMSGVESNAFAEAFLIDPLLDLIDECAAAAQCRSAYPDFERQLGSVAAELEQRPQRIGGELVSHVEYLAQIRYALADPERRGRIPLAVERSARGDHRAWADLRIADGPRAAGGRDPAFTWPGSVCRDEHPRRNDPDRQQAARRAVPDAVRRGARMVDGESWDWATFCPRMGFEKSAPETVAIPRSDVPALMLVGQLDLVTPKTWNDQVARSMSDTRTVVFPSTDHFVLLRQTQCAGDLMRGFYADPKAPLDTRCVDALPKTVWAIDRTDKVRR
jgi:pimeloyl-ACP methyl ester carboxylesterase